MDKEIMDMQRTVLIVDDEKSIVDILKFNLEKEQFETLCAYDGPEGLKLAREKIPISFFWT